MLRVVTSSVSIAFLLAASCSSPVLEPSAPRAAGALGRWDARHFGVVGDGETLESEAIQRAVDQISAGGGGTLVFPPGDYRTGTVRLKDNVTLHLENGCTLWGSKDIADYDPERTHLLYARDAENVVLCGQGAIDGTGPSFWDGGRLERWLRGEGPLERTADMLRFDRCRNVVLQDVDIRYGAFWNVGFGDCDRVTLRALSLRNGIDEEDGPNTDGINLWHCSRVQVSDCDIQTGDDCLVVLGDSRDVTITNCKFTTTETALMISGVRNLTFSNSTIHNAGCGIGFRVWNGIVVDGVRVDNIVMDVSADFDSGGQAIYLWSFPLYVETELPASTPLPAAGIVDNVTISNVTARANGGVFVNGFRESEGYVRNLSLDNVRIFMNGGKKKSPRLNVDPPDPYPIYGFHGAPYAMFFRHVRDLRLSDVQFQWNTPEQEDWGGPLRCWSVENLLIDGFVGRQAEPSDAPAIWLKDVDSAIVRDCVAPAGTGVFLRLDEGTADVSLMGNDLHRAQQAYTVSPGATPVLFEQGNRMPPSGGSR